MKIAVLLTTHDMVPAGFAYDYGKMMLHVGGTAPEGVQIAVHMATSTYVHDGRQKLLEGCLREEVVPNYILWIDTDMRFPMDALHQLLARMEEDPSIKFIGINYASRAVPAQYVAIKECNWRPDQVGSKLVTTDDSTGVEEVEALGLGFFLCRAEALLDLPENQPWFWYEWLGDGRVVGEDVYFCRLLRQMGHKLYVDHDLSNRCAHIGLWEYKLPMVEAMQEVARKGA